MSVRRRLVAVLLTVTLVGLALTAALTTTAVRSFLYGRVDAQLAALSGSRSTSASFPPTGRDGAFRPGGGPSVGAASGTAPVAVAADPPASAGSTPAVDPEDDDVVLVPRPGLTFCDRTQFRSPQLIFERYGTDGSLICAPQADVAGGGGPSLDRAELAVAPSGPFTVSARTDGTRYRVVTQRTVDGEVLAFGIDLTDTDATWHRLLYLQIALMVAVLAALGAGAWWLVRLGLKPLDDMATTAQHIASGDLSRRIDHTDPRTEAGRLGDALNAMLEQIEEGFRDKERNEDTLQRFVADASHELRTPVAAIRGYAELFGRGAAHEPDDLAVVMRRIEQAAERMGVLVDDLLLLSRLDGGRALVDEPVGFSEVVAVAVQDARAADSTRPLVADLQPQVIVDGDAHALHQVLDNLLANVRTHTAPDAPCEVVLSAGPSWARLAVIDHGPGIPEPDRARVFERFTRLDAARARSTGGAGLGLAIVGAIVRAHHGTITLEGTPGGGATFVVELPLHVAPASFAGAAVGDPTV